MSDYERLTSVLKEVFLKRGIFKKEDWAKCLGYNKGYLSGILNGKEAISDSFLKKISDEFGVNPDWVKTGDGDVFLESENKEPSTPASDGSLTIPAEVWDVLKMQVEGLVLKDASLREKDMHIERLINLLEKQISENKENTESATARFDRVIDLLERQMSTSKKSTAKGDAGAPAEVG